MTPQTTKPNFSKISRAIHAFEKAADFDGTPTKQLLLWLDHEVHNYRQAKSVKVKQGKLMDIIILSLQISRREKLDLDAAWDEWWLKSRKYLKKTSAKDSASQRSCKSQKA